MPILLLLFLIIIIVSCFVISYYYPFFKIPAKSIIICASWFGKIQFPENSQLSQIHVLISVYYNFFNTQT